MMSYIFNISNIEILLYEKNYEGLNDGYDNVFNNNIEANDIAPRKLRFYANIDYEYSLSEDDDYTFYICTVL